MAAGLHMPGLPSCRGSFACRQGQHQQVPPACATLTPPCLRHTTFHHGKSLILQSSLSSEGHRAHAMTSL